MEVLPAIEIKLADNQATPAARQFGLRCCGGVPFASFHRREANMSSVTLQMTMAFAFGVVFIITLLTLAIRFPHPSPFQYTIFRIVLSIAAAGVAAMVPGFLSLEVTSATLLLIRAGGALAVFVIVFFFKPAALHTNSELSANPQIPSPPARLPNGAPFTDEMRGAFRQVWAALGDVHVAGERLWREVSPLTLEAFATSLGRAQKCVATNALFFNDIDYTAIRQALQSADFYYDGKRQLSELYDAADTRGQESSSHTFILVHKYISERIAENKRWLGEYGDVLAQLRSSLHRAMVA
jgi:hypothetical protein